MTRLCTSEANKYLVHIPHLPQLEPNEKNYFLN